MNKNFIIAIIIFITIALLCKSDVTKDTVKKQLKPSRPKLYYFRSNKHELCKDADQQLEIVKSQNNGTYDFIYVDVDSVNGRDIAKKYDVTEIPSLILVKPCCTVKYDGPMTANEISEFLIADNTTSIMSLLLGVPL